MAALDVSGIVLFSVAANELVCKGRAVRGAEKWGKAAEAARALGKPDCLVVAYAQIREADSLLLAANSETPERAHALYRRVCTELLPPAMAVLERRRLADTLLVGKCAPHEVEWWLRHHTASGIRDVRVMAQYAQFIGYEVYLRTALLGMFWVCVGSRPSLNAPTTPAQTEQIISCVATALDLMRSPWLEKETCFNYEAAFVEEVKRVTLEGDVYFSREHRDALAAALGRLAGSGMLEKREMDDAVQTAQRKSLLLRAKADAEKEAPGLQSCAHCSAREVHMAQFKRCSACKGPRFCSKDCQLANWPQHKAACKAARKAAAGAAAGT